MFIDGTTANASPLARTVLMTVDATGGVFTYAVSLATASAKTGAKIHLASMGPKPRPEQAALVRAVPGATLHESATRSSGWTRRGQTSRVRVSGCGISRSRSGPTSST